MSGKGYLHLEIYLRSIFPSEAGKYELRTYFNTTYTYAKVFNICEAP